MDMRIPPLRIKIMLESNPLKSTMLVGRLGVSERGEVLLRGVTCPVHGSALNGIALVGGAVLTCPAHGSARKVNSQL